MVHRLGEEANIVSCDGCNTMRNEMQTTKSTWGKEYMGLSITHSRSQIRAGLQFPSDYEKAHIVMKGVGRGCEAVKLCRILKIDITSKEQQKIQN